VSFNILNGDAREMLSTLPSDSVDCIVTSPPYWGLRDYGVEGQIGLEPTLNEFLDRLAQVFEECWRVLKPTGTLWINMGDCYFTGAGSARLPGGGTQGKEFQGPKIQPNRVPGSADVRKKSLVGQPWRLAFRLIDQGWILRSEIIWHKPNPMPESVQDRPTRSHEQLFLFTKEEKYFYNGDAIRTPCPSSTLTRIGQGVDDQIGSNRVQGKTNGNMIAVSKSPAGCDRSNGSHGTIHKEGRTRKRDDPSIVAGSAKGIDERKGGYPTANSRTVWTIPTEGFKGSHFATFPREIPRRCILAGCPERGVVLDPFAGSGTTSEVALSLGRKAIAIELNPEYMDLIKDRVSKVQIPFAELFEEFA
jgi:DNA modification methylase